jgi:hypothetical protein
MLAAPAGIDVHIIARRDQGETTAAIHDMPE